MASLEPARRRWPLGGLRRVDRIGWERIVPSHLQDVRHAIVTGAACMPRISRHRFKGIAAAFGVVVGVSAMLGAQDAKIDPSQADRITARIVANLCVLRSQHR